MRDKVLSLLSIAAKSGSVKSGEFMTEKSVKEGLSFLVIVSSEASDNTKKKFKDMGAFHDVPVYIHGSKDDLGRCIGKEFRASLSVNDEGLAKELIKRLEASDA